MELENIHIHIHRDQNQIDFLHTENIINVECRYTIDTQTPNIKHP